MKKCPVCKIETTDWTPAGNACAPCARKRATEHRVLRRKDPEYVKEYNAKIVKKNSDLKKKAIDYLGGKCIDCSGVFEDCVYDFHHVDMSTKEGNPSYFLKGTSKWERAKEELDKCVLLCANCHRVRHFSRIIK